MSHMTYSASTQTDTIISSPTPTLLYTYSWHETVCCLRHSPLVVEAKLAYSLIIHILREEYES
jgi:hypothetical protein